MHPFRAALVAAVAVFAGAASAQSITADVWAASAA